MCGINLIVDKLASLDEQPILKMNQSVLHRGPDASDWKLIRQNDQNIYLGTNRLKIIDPSNDANQPFVSADGNFVFVYNGEVYNYQKLKEELNNNAFQSNSDTEVVFKLLIEQGIAACEKLNGMFAFVFIDQRNKTISLVRDPSGIKPLYYYEDERCFIASSEIKGILASGLIKKELNANQIGNYLRYKYAKRPETFYKNIYELEPGHFLKIATKGIEINTYTKNSISSSLEVNEYSVVSSVRKLLQESIQRHLISDVPTGLFLSGGVDSTLLLALIAETGIKKFPTFSIIHNKSDKNFGTEDFHYARLAAERYNAEHHILEANISVLNRIDEVVEKMDQPIGDSAILLTHLISEHARTKVKVALSGAGADELFAGYNRHKAYQFYLQHLQARPFLLKCLQKTSGILPEGFNHPYRKHIRLWNKFVNNISPNPYKTYDHFISLNFGAPGSNLSGIAEIGNYGLQMDRNQYLISDVLALTDKMSMANSLEVRVPYLDKELQNFIKPLSAEFLLKNGQKWILKSILNDMGGQVFTTRSKEGFGLPLGQWIREKQKLFFNEVLQDKKSLLFEHISYEKVLKIFNLHLSSKKDYSSEIWSLILLKKWLANEFE